MAIDDELSVALTETSSDSEESSEDEADTDSESEANEVTKSDSQAEDEEGKGLTVTTAETSDIELESGTVSAEGGSESNDEDSDASSVESVDFETGSSGDEASNEESKEGSETTETFADAKGEVTTETDQTTNKEVVEDVQTSGKEEQPQDTETDVDRLKETESKEGPEKETITEAKVETRIEQGKEEPKKEVEREVELQEQLKEEKTQEPELTTMPNLDQVGPKEETQEAQVTGQQPTEETKKEKVQEAPITEPEKEEAKTETDETDGEPIQQQAEVNAAESKKETDKEEDASKKVESIDQISQQQAGGMAETETNIPVEIREEPSQDQTGNKAEATPESEGKEEEDVKKITEQEQTVVDEGNEPVKAAAEIKEVNEAVKDDLSEETGASQECVESTQGEDKVQEQPQAVQSEEVPTHDRTMAKEDNSDKTQKEFLTDERKPEHEEHTKQEISEQKRDTSSEPSKLVIEEPQPIEKETKKKKKEKKEKREKKKGKKEKASESTEAKDDPQPKEVSEPGKKEVHPEPDVPAAVAQSVAIESEAKPEPALAEPEIITAAETNLVATEPGSVTGDEVKSVVAEPEVVTGDDVKPVVAEPEVVPGDDVKPVMAEPEVVPGDDVKPVSEEPEVVPAADTASIPAEKDTPAESEPVLVIEQNVEDQPTPEAVEKLEVAKDDTDVIESVINQTEPPKAQEGAPEPKPEVTSEKGAPALDDQQPELEQPQIQAAPGAQSEIVGDKPESGSQESQEVKDECAYTQLKTMLQGEKQEAEQSKPVSQDVDAGNKEEDKKEGEKGQKPDPELDRIYSSRMLHIKSLVKSQEKLHNLLDQTRHDFSTLDAEIMSIRKQYAPTYKLQTRPSLRSKYY